VKIFLCRTSSTGKRNKYFLAICLIIFLFLHAPEDIQSQENRRIIKLHSIYPSDSSSKNPGFLKTIEGLITGEKAPVIPVRPISVFARSCDYYWIVDQGGEKLIEVRQNEGVVLAAGQGLKSLVDICGTPENELFFTESGINKIFWIDPENKKIQELVVSFELHQPTGIAYSALRDEIWLVETARHCISIINRRGELIKRIGERGTGLGEFNFPTFIWIDKNGIAYIVDSMNFRIQVINPGGEVTAVFGQAGDATGYFARPKGIAVDSSGNIYVADALFHAIQVFDREGNFLHTFGNQGRDPGEFWMPAGIFIDNDDYIYIADSYNSRIQVFEIKTVN
jgi:sugar lactone lactonase YvrE